MGVNLITLGTRTTSCFREYVISAEEVSTLHLTTITESRVNAMVSVVCKVRLDMNCVHQVLVLAFNEGYLRALSRCQRRCRS